MHSYTESATQHETPPLCDASGKTTGGSNRQRARRYRTARAPAGLSSPHGRTEPEIRVGAASLAAISHEIRTPMNAIMGMLELTLLQDSLTAPVRQQLDTALRSARSMLSLIDDLLDLSKMGAGKLSLKPSFVSLRDIAEEVAGVFSPVANSKGVALRVEVEPSVAECHFIDPLRLKQILNNLLSNAIRFTTHGHVHIEIKAARAREGHQRVQLSIIDTGAGIPPEALPVLFEPFMQVDSAATAGGTGLGLPICKRLADAMGGHIRVYSTLGAGTRVTVHLRLPAKEVPNPAQTRPSPESGAEAPILVVNDQASNRILLGHQLRRLGHSVVFAEDGLQALQAIDRQAFKLVICDCAMPQMDGLEFVRVLRKRQDKHARIPVLGYTAGVQNTSLQDMIGAGMNSVLFTPVGLAELKAALQAHLPDVLAHAARASEDSALVSAAA